MSPELRRALHQALDIVLDAVAAEEREASPKRKRARREPELPEVSEEALERAEKAWAGKGWRKTG